MLLLWLRKMCFGHFLEYLFKKMYTLKKRRTQKHAASWFRYYAGRPQCIAARRAHYKTSSAMTVIKKQPMNTIQHHVVVSLSVNMPPASLSWSPFAADC